MPLWGAVEGSRLAEQDAQVKQLNALTMQKEQVSIAQSMMTLQQQAMMMKQMGGGDGGQPPSPDQLASVMDRMAASAVNAGLFDKAEKFATTGSTIRKNQIEIESKQSTDTIKEMNLFSSLLQGVDSEQSWQQANAMFQLQTGKASPFSRVPYNPALVGKLQIGVQTAKDRALTEAAQARARASDAAAEEARARKPLIAAQTRVALDRADALEKAGDKAAVPKASQKRQITDLLTDDFGLTVDPETMRVKAQPVAERMVELIRRDHLTESEAAHRAYDEAKQRGDFEGIRNRMPQMGTLRRPMEIPEDKGKLKVNMIYKGKGQYQGQLLVWTGTGFRLAKQPAAAAIESDAGLDAETETP